MDYKNESLEDRKKRADEIYNRLKKMYPEAKTALRHTSAWELLVASILSAQCTDKRVNMITPLLFKKYPEIEDFAQAEKEELEKLIYSTGFYRNKAKNIIGAAKKILNDFKGNVPDNMENLVTIPGVARKTANVILSSWFKKNEGVVVDTHVKRISQRLGLTENKTPEKIEKDLMNIYEKKKWGPFSYMIVDHGRALCKAPTPKCILCGLKDICPSSSKYL
jgi:endonuclease-3